MTTPEPPSALLRRAAERLDDLLSALPSGPVRLEYHYRRGTTVLAQVDLHGPAGSGSNVPQHKVYAPSRVAQAEFALATQPDTVRDFMEMLRSAATMADGTAGVGSVHIVRHAVNAARKILGETP